MKWQSSEFPERGEGRLHRCSLWVVLFALGEAHPVWCHLSFSCTSGQLWAPLGQPRARAGAALAISIPSVKPLEVRRHQS